MPWSNMSSLQGFSGSDTTAYTGLISPRARYFCASGANGAIFATTSTALFLRQVQPSVIRFFRSNIVVYFTTALVSGDIISSISFLNNIR